MKTEHGCFDGLRGRYLRITRGDALNASHAGRCDDDVAALERKPYVSKQLDKFTPEQLRESLKECGAWDEDDLSDHAANRLRVVWIAAGDIREILINR